LIGGAHISLTLSGTTARAGGFDGIYWTQADVDAIAGFNQWSLWDLFYRPVSDPRGMVCVGGAFWADIYLCAQDYTQGSSRAKVNLAGGQNKPPRPAMQSWVIDDDRVYSTGWYEAQAIALSLRKRLPTMHEFAAAAFGVTERQSSGVFYALISNRVTGYTSRWGLEQATGHLWVWGQELLTDPRAVNGTGAGASITTLRVAAVEPFMPSLVLKPACAPWYWGAAGTPANTAAPAAPA